MPNTASGGAGERFAAEYLRKKCYRIAAVNFRCRFGEIDIVAENGRYIAFVEVKTRGAGSFTHPFEAITPGKRARIVKTAQFYLLGHPTGLQPRFDAAAFFMPGDAPRGSNTSKTYFSDERLGRLCSILTCTATRLWNA